LIYEDVRETRKFYVEAADYQTAIVAWAAAQEAGDEGSFVDASTLSYEVQLLDESGTLSKRTQPSR